MEAHSGFRKGERKSGFGNQFYSWEKEIRKDNRENLDVLTRQNSLFKKKKADSLGNVG